MDLNDSAREAAFRAEARAFLAEHAPGDLPAAAEMAQDEDAVMASSGAWQRTLYEHGWAAITWPTEYGGRGCGPIEQIIWNQELARANVPQTLYVVGIGMAGPTIVSHGTAEQKTRYLDPLLRGEEIWCQLFSEPGAGSDLAALATRAVRDGDDWLVSGQKTWCSGAHYGHYGMLLARTDPSVPKHQGITYFLVDMNTPGIEVRPLRQMNGGSHFNEVFLDQVRIPDANRIGDEGAGWGVAMTTLMNERMSMGGAESFFSFDDLADYARAHRERLDDVARDELARLYTWVRTLELLNASVITKLGHGQIPDSESSVMKLAIARLLTRAGDIGLRIAGADGLARRGPWQDQFLFAPAMHIAGGTDEVQKNVAAERVLGLPREERGDRDVPFDQLTRS